MSDLATTPVGDYLYFTWHSCWDGCWGPGDPWGQSPDHQCYEVVECPIVKVTPTRVYFKTVRYTTEAERAKTRFVDRARLEANGYVYHAAVRELLYLEPPELYSRRKTFPDLAELKQAMADAHPDRGGTDAEFIAARARYENARGQR